jgi:hypothetical protein
LKTADGFHISTASTTAGSLALSDSEGRLLSLKKSEAHLLVAAAVEV